MQLTYLGQRYTASSASIDTIETNTELQFMGCPFKRRVPAAMPAQAPKHHMIYRGQSYRG
ncbi:DUF4278 domain-containing protein [cf. Phormidesmis sp. LEGE 11477]|uniref:DUF4278 domain-containing protein n=1 Tax=cf. Phormidesmis sp. LEGE 11477 TaxID=1828680 RepID=UPI001881CACF|nr:DUF4278 domain-containing protein [cf. Phormidesmis sp. LEGE 11477]MBE9064271.1 DUF4278 domain-containing protein [cf. Phormidesmis sp. LEGE 11477]